MKDNKNKGAGVRYDQQDELERTALATSRRPGFRLENTCSVCGHHRARQKHDSRICSPIARARKEQENKGVVK